MPNRKIRTIQEAEDLIRGLTLYGTGGGGRPEKGREYLLPRLPSEEGIGWVDLAEIPDDAWVCSGFGMGSTAPTPALSREVRTALGYGEMTIERPLAEAVRMLAEATGRRVAAVVPFELGAGNTTGVLDAGVHLGVAVVDADFAGRAIPRLDQTTAAIAGIDICPATICDSWGNRLLLQAANSLRVAERVGKMVSMATKLPDMRAICAHAGFLLTGRQLREVAVPGTITRALVVGRAIREAVEEGRDLVAAAAEATCGWVIFEGVVLEKPWENRDGYMFGEIAIEGQERFVGRRMRIWYQNENHMTWLDDQPHVTSPDLIMVLDRRTGEPFTNADLQVGQEVGVLAARADPRLRTLAALAVLGPASFGFAIAYVPVDERLRRLS